MGDDTERFVSSLDRQAEMATVKTLRDWVRDRVNLGPGSTVLDVGCGTGAELVELAALVQPHGHALGVDANRAMLETARRRTTDHTGLLLIDGEASAIPVADSAVDAVVCERVLQHLDYPPEVAVQEFARVTRIGGTVALTDTDWSSLQVVIRDDEAATEFLRQVRERLELPFTSNQKVGRFLGDYCVQADLQLVDQRCAALTDFQPALVLAVLGGVKAAAAQLLGPGELHEAETLLDDTLEQNSLQISVQMHAVVARRTEPV
ncbi:methyltransferase domain-containing protein [Tsukamurella sp. 1534]|uniref:methyltransferase domain-containing protein n=1 Tax=Tsukamurella sp. 1534 TaxID=1151061 RepID=UPI0002E38F72|nr:methyltransferase domain-containing protein [Tsukamurella sp. 1534]